MRLDRKMPTVHRYRRHNSSQDMAKQSFADDASMYPRERTPESEEDDADAVQDADFVHRLSERWRYDAENGKVGLGLGVADEDQVILDDFEPR